MMSMDFMPRLATSLIRGQVWEAMEMLRPWLRDYGASAGAITSLLSVCPSMARRPLVTLLMDILTDYPRRIVGVPALFYAVPDHGRRAPESFFLPAAGDGMLIESGPEIEFVGWAPVDTILPDIWLCGQQRRVEARTWEICATVAAFKLQQEPDDQLLSPLLEWWGSVFLRTGHCISMSTGGFALPYPAAVEAAQAMAAASSDAMPLSGGRYDEAWFLSVADHARAMWAGSDFRRSIQEDSMGSKE